MRNGTLVTMSCSYGSAVFKQLLKQQVHDAGTSRFSRWSQSHAGFESVNLLQHPVRANRTSKMWLMWLRIIPSFQRCTVLWEKSPRSVRKLCKNSCNGNYETPCMCANLRFWPMRFFPMRAKIHFFFLRLSGVMYGSTVGKLTRNKIAWTCLCVGTRDLSFYFTFTFL